MSMSFEKGYVVKLSEEVPGESAIESKWILGLIQEQQGILMRVSNSHNLNLESGWADDEEEDLKKKVLSLVDAYLATPTSSEYTRIAKEIAELFG